MKRAWYVVLPGVAAALLLLTPPPAAAQRDTVRATPTDTAYRSEDIPRATRPPDFLFQQPRISLELRGGMAFPHAGSQIFSFSTRELTLSKSDFNAATFAGDLAIRLTPRTELALGVGYARSAPWSESRNYLDNNNKPIEQQTILTQWPLTAALRWYLLPRGQQIGHFVWVPARFTPYVGLGAGAMRHTFEQTGDFVDYQTLAVFPATYISEGWSPLAQAIGGVDIALSRHIAAKAEARYTYSKAKMGIDFQDFDKLDLSGLQTTVGLGVRF